MKVVKSIIYILCLITLAGFNPLSVHNEEALSIAIIINKDNPIENMDAGQVKLYWLKKIKKRWPEINKNIRPADRKSNSLEQAMFYSKVLNMSPDEVENYFINKQYQNAERPQDKFVSDQEILDFVIQEVGAIGYVNVQSLDAATKEKVRVVHTVQ